jgi:hypothetical protein
MQNATQTIAHARVILAMDFLAVNEEIYAQVLSELEDLRFGIADLQTADVIAALSRDLSDRWDRAFRHVSADEIKMAVDVADEVGEILARLAKRQ